MRTLFSLHPAFAECVVPISPATQRRATSKASTPATTHRAKPTQRTHRAIGSVFDNLKTPFPLVLCQTCLDKTKQPPLLLYLLLLSTPPSGDEKLERCADATPLRKAPNKARRSKQRHKHHDKSMSARYTHYLFATPNSQHRSKKSKAFRRVEQTITRHSPANVPASRSLGKIKYKSHAVALCP